MKKLPEIVVHGSHVAMMDIGAVRPYKGNARLHSDAQIKALAATITQSGFTAPLIIDDTGTLISGHGRLLAAQALEMKTVPCVTAKNLSPQQIRALRISDNQLALASTWNSDVLVAELNALQGFGFDLGDMGFGDLELGTMGVAGFALEERLQKAEITPELSKRPVVKRGELWILGDHRLKIGDSTNPEDVTHLLGGAKPGLLVSDPPYGVNYDPNWRNEAARSSKGMGNRAIGAGAVGKVSNDDRADWTPAWKLFPGDVAYVWHGALHGPVVGQSLAGAGFLIRAQIIWDKTRLIIGRGDYHWEHEPAYYVVRKGKPGGWTGDRKQTTVWRIAHRASETGHGTQKPIECMRRPILNNSKPGDLVYDPFAGSGTTCISAHMEKRRSLNCEIDPAYAQVILERWEKFADATAKREDGKTLAQLKKGKK